MPDSKDSSSPKPERASQISYDRWQQVTKDPLFLQVLQAYRGLLVRRHLVADFSNEEGRLVMATIRGEMNLVDTFNSGAMDELAQQVCGLRVPTVDDLGQPHMAIAPSVLKEIEDARR